MAVREESARREQELVAEAGALRQEEALRRSELAELQQAAASKEASLRSQRSQEMQEESAGCFFRILQRYMKSMLGRGLARWKLVALSRGEDAKRARLERQHKIEAAELKKAHVTEVAALTSAAQTMRLTYEQRERAAELTVQGLQVGSC